MSFINDVLESISASLGFNELEKYGLYSFLLGIILVIVMPSLAFIILVCTSIFFGCAGIVALFSENENERSSSYHQKRQSTSIQPTTSAPITNTPTIAEQIKSINATTGLKCPSCGASIRAYDTKCKYCDSPLIPKFNLARPAVWGDVEINQVVGFAHPIQGKIAPRVTRLIYYGELWQVKMKADVPWTLTGNYFVGLHLDNGMYLLNWQARCFLLDSDSNVADMVINRDFAPFARKFAASNQTANIIFPYENKDWRMDDIGRFRIELTDGEGTGITPGVIGRFIHASYKNQVLIVEDFESGGSGLDTIWQGYSIDIKDVNF